MRGGRDVEGIGSRGHADRIVHGALQRDMLRAREAATSPRRLVGSGGRSGTMVWLMDFLDAHHTGEDEGLWPAVREEPGCRSAAGLVGGRPPAHRAGRCGAAVGGRAYAASATTTLVSVWSRRSTTWRRCCSRTSIISEVTERPCRSCRRRSPTVSGGPSSRSTTSAQVPGPNRLRGPLAPRRHRPAGYDVVVHAVPSRLPVHPAARVRARSMAGCGVAA